jgi:beta-glucanase (GH16 family)
MTTPRSLALVAILLSASCLPSARGQAAAATTGDLDNPNAPLSIKANKEFDDEFDTAPVGAPAGKDASGKITRWRTSLWFGSGYNRQGGGQGYYADDFFPPPKWSGSAIVYNPFSVAHGILSITARPMTINGVMDRLHYGTGILTTMDSFLIDYGYFEIRLKCPGAPGNWTAFFLYPADDYHRKPQSKYTKWEMDFLEILGSGPDKLHTTTHQRLTPNAPNVADESDVTTGPNDDDFHTFGFDKEPGKIDVYRDGKLILTKKPTSRMTSAGYICLTLDVGKDNGWAGTPDPTQYPQSLQVDYVRVYKTPATTVIGGPFAAEQEGDLLLNND